MVVFLDASRNFYLFIYGGRLGSENIKKKKKNYGENKEDLWKGHGNCQSISSNVLVLSFNRWGPNLSKGCGDIKDGSLTCTRKE